MNNEIKKIQSFLLASLRKDLEANNPDFVKLMVDGTAENSFNFPKAVKLLTEPTEPWSELLSLLLDLELGYDFCKLTVENISNTSCDRELHFHIRTYSIYFRAILERLECLVKKLNRKGVISDINKVLEFTSEALKHPGLNQERHTAAHGRFTGTDSPIGGVQTEHFWEPLAIIQLDESQLDGWHQSYGNNKGAFINQINEEFNSLSNSLCNVLRAINDQCYKGLNAHSLEKFTHQPLGHALRCLQRNRVFNKECFNG